ncbi:MAG TPA: TatD family hydrolase [Dehalococcoidia bacterium]|nr:TatD family hydrolase [Dehalococcoidia bacterium]
MLIDSHCHLHDEEFAADREAVLVRARDAGVEAFVAIGTDLASSRRAIDLAASEPDVFAAAGVHPHDASTLDVEALAQLRTLAAAPKVVAIGEIGLDFYRNLSAPEQQRRAFRRQLTVAVEIGLPVVIHSRDAEEETFDILAEYARHSRLPEGRPLGVLHCFASDLPLAERYVEMGFVISIAGICTYPKAEKTCGVAAGLPLQRLAVETDAPYLAPQSHRGQRNEPAYLRETVEHIARLRGQPYETVAAATSATTARLFGIETAVLGRSA